MTLETQRQSITLYYRQGNSDKIYMTGLEPKGAGFVVNFAFGRRGATLQTGTKTPSPMDYQTARAVYDKLVREKMAKGYTPGQDGTPYQGTDREAAATGIFPQLLNSIDEEQALRLIDDDEWWMQEKFDGKRIMIRKQDGQIIGINRKGLAVALPQSIVEQALALGGGEKLWLMDGEAVGDTYVAFDLLERDGVDLRAEPYSRRFEALRDMAPRTPGGIRIADTARDAAAKQTKLARLRSDNREGVVFKRFSAPYTPGRPARGGDQLKLKVTATASCLVAKVSKAKRSVALELLDGRKRVAVGNVTIPANQSVPKAGDIVEIRFLYAYPGGSLFQPVCLGLRDDVGLDACTVGQLKFKAGDTESEENEP